MNDNISTTRRKRKNHTVHFFPSALIGFLFVFILVLAGVIFIVYRNGASFDTLRRYIRYGSEEKTPTYVYDSSENTQFALLGEYLVVLTNTSLRLLNSSGAEIWSTPVHMSAPALAYGGGRVVAYDIGGGELHVIDSGGQALELSATESEPFLSAHLNENGYLTVTSGKQGYKGCVRVYDNNLKLTFAFNSSERFLIDACMTDDNTYLTVATLGQENGVFITNIILYRLNSKIPETNYNINNALIVDIAQRGKYLVTISDSKLVYAKTEGKINAVYSYDETYPYLRDYDLNGKNFSVLLLNRYQTGNTGRLITVNDKGEELASLDVQEEIESLSAAGHYIAVLYTNSLIIYNQKLQVYASISDTDKIRKVIMRDDGSVLLLGMESAQLYLP